MRQGVLPFQYAEERSETGMTALAGLPLYLELMRVVGLAESVDRHVGLRARGQGWTDGMVVQTMVLLQIAGGDAVADLGVLEGDAGFKAVVEEVERREREAMAGRWPRGRRRTVPSPSAVFRYLAGFHNAGEEEKRRPHAAFIPQANEALRGCGKVNGDLMAFAQRLRPVKTATLDMDATLAETHKREALFSYKGYRAYQPLTTYWAEQGLALHSEFRDGNVPAGYEQRRVLEEALAFVPPGVERVYLRSDTAGYQQELLRYCAEGRHPRFGVIEFAIGVDVTAEFKRAVAEVEAGDWHPLKREPPERKRRGPDQEWAEVCFVPNWMTSKNGPTYHYLAIREPLSQTVLPGMEEQLPFPTAEFKGQRYKIFGVVTNRDLPGDIVIRWLRQRCGQSEKAHGVMKEDLAGGKLPSGDFGENAAWWAITLLAFNLNVLMKHLVLGAGWLDKQLKALRFGLIALPGRVVRHARQLVVQVSQGHPAFGLLLAARQRILAIATGPSG